MNFSYFMEIVMSGVVSGASYALIGAGLSLIWGTLKMVNLAHGEFYMLGAYFLWTSITVGHMPILLAIIISLIFVLICGCVVQVVMIRPLLRKPNWNMSPWILTLGIQILLQNAALHIWGELFLNVPYFWNTVYKPFSLFTISGQRIIIIFGTFLVIAFLIFITKKTRLGRAIAATSQDREYAMMMGINTKRIYTYTYIISAALAGIAGIMLCPVYSVYPYMGTMVQTKGMIVCILGGLGNIEGAIVAGILMGVIESFAVSIIGSEWRDAFAYILLILVLYFRPNGLFGVKEDRK